jgi:hypothetical protein
MLKKQFMLIAVAAVLIMQGCDDSPAKYEEVRLELKNLNELTFRAQAVQLDICAHLAGASGYYRDNKFLKLKGHKARALRLCENNASKILSCESDLKIEGKVQFETEGQTQLKIDQTCYSVDLTKCESKSTCSSAERDKIYRDNVDKLTCLETQLEYMKKYTAPQSERWINDYKQLAKLKDVEYRDFAKEKYAETCGYL